MAVDLNEFYQSSASLDELCRVHVGRWIFVVALTSLYLLSLSFLTGYFACFSDMLCAFLPVNRSIGIIASACGLFLILSLRTRLFSNLNSLFVFAFLAAILLILLQISISCSSGTIETQTNLRELPCFLPILFASFTMQTVCPYIYKNLNGQKKTVVVSRVPDPGDHLRALDDLRAQNGFRRPDFLATLAGACGFRRRTDCLPVRQVAVRFRRRGFENSHCFGGCNIRHRLRYRTVAIVAKSVAETVGAFLYLLPPCRYQSFCAKPVYPHFNVYRDDFGSFYDFRTVLSDGAPYETALFKRIVLLPVRSDGCDLRNFVRMEVMY